MREIKGNIWDFHKKGHWIVIPTNGTVRRDGACVMGRGVAAQAKAKFPELPKAIGQCLRIFGNEVFIMDQGDLRMLTFPVKHNWWEKADLRLIEESCKKLKATWSCDDEIYMVRPGCGNGKLDWKEVKPLLEKYLDDRFIVVER
jgi:hypothetical protein